MLCVLPTPHHDRRKSSCGHHRAEKIQNARAAEKLERIRRNDREHTRGRCRICFLASVGIDRAIKIDRSGKTSQIATVAALTSESTENDPKMRYPAPGYQIPGYPARRGAGAPKMMLGYPDRTEVIMPYLVKYRNPALAKTSRQLRTLSTGNNTECPPRAGSAPAPGLLQPIDATQRKTLSALSLPDVRRRLEDAAHEARLHACLRFRGLFVLRANQCVHVAHLLLQARPVGAAVACIAEGFALVCLAIAVDLGFTDMAISPLGGAAAVHQGDVADGDRPPESILERSGSTRRSTRSSA